MILLHLNENEQQRISEENVSYDIDKLLIFLVLPVHPLTDMLLFSYDVI